VAVKNDYSGRGQEFNEIGIKTYQEKSNIAVKANRTQNLQGRKCENETENHENKGGQTYFWDWQGAASLNRKGGESVGISGVLQKNPQIERGAGRLIGNSKTKKKKMQGM